MSRDVDLPHVSIDGHKHRRVYRDEKIYPCAVGPVGDAYAVSGAPGERAVATMERRVGIVEGYWTPVVACCYSELMKHQRPVCGL